MNYCNVVKRLYQQFQSCSFSSSLLHKKYPLQVKLYVKSFRVSTATLHTSPSCYREKSSRNKTNKKTELFIPVPVNAAKDSDVYGNIGEELSGKISKDDISNILSQFYERKPVRHLSEENGLEIRLFHQAFVSFRKYCLDSDSLPVELHLIFNDILQECGHPDDIFPFFLRHARQVFPHLDCMEELRSISDVRVPANWYPEARAMNRKIIFHAGPTNSGKTFHALERFFSAKTGVYCGPLKLLAVEIFTKSKQHGIPCDLVTGEERRFVSEDGTPASHVACTVEMTSISTPFEVAIIDEIQMLRDSHRGWAWTRALLGVTAQEVHVCGEPAAIDIVKAIVQSVEEEFEVRHYKRLTKLEIDDTPLNSYKNVKPGDCIVCFSKNDIFNVSRELERQGTECAVIYGALPPGAKLAQAQKFNDPSDPCKVLVATDAIGMGLNLSIQRIIFNTIVRPGINEKGEMELGHISTSHALQIGGRAGRYGTDFETGHVTTFSPKDLPVLTKIMKAPVDSLTAAGLLPTAEQLELFAYHLPHATLSNLIDIFVSVCQLDLSQYFMCQFDNFKFLADMIQHIPLPLMARYLFCCAPINIQQSLVCTMFLKFARQYSRNEYLTLDWLCRHISWPFNTPRNITELIHLEAVFDTLDLYLWLSYRFSDLFPDGNLVRDMQRELDVIIQAGVLNISRLLEASETKVTSTLTRTQETDILVKRKKDKYRKVATGKLENIDSSEKDALNRLKLSDRLVAQGLLSADLLKQLKKEFTSENVKEENHAEKIEKKSKRTKKK